MWHQLLSQTPLADILSCQDLCRLSACSKSLREAVLSDDIWTPRILKDFGPGGLTHPLFVYRSYFRYRDLVKLVPKTSDALVEVVKAGHTHVLKYAWEHYGILPPATIENTSAVYLALKHGHVDTATWINTHFAVIPFEPGSISNIICHYRQYPEVTTWLFDHRFELLIRKSDLIFGWCLEGGYYDGAMRILPHIRTWDPRRPYMDDALASGFQDIVAILEDKGYTPSQRLMTKACLKRDIDLFNLASALGYIPSQDDINKSCPTSNLDWLRFLFLRGLYPDEMKMCVVLKRYPQFAYLLVNVGLRLTDIMVHCVWRYGTIRMQRFMWRYDYLPSAYHRNLLFMFVNLETAKLISRDHTIPKCKLPEIFQKGKLSVIRYLMESGYQVPQVTVDKYFEFARIDRLRLVLRYGYRPTFVDTSITVKTDIIEYALGCSTKDTIYKSQSSCSSSQRIQTLVEVSQYGMYPSSANIKRTIRGYPRPYDAIILDWLIRNNITMNAHDVTKIMYDGNVNINRVFLRHGYGPTTDMVEYAALNNDRLYHLYSSYGYALD